MTDMPLLDFADSCWVEKTFQEHQESAANDSAPAPQPLGGSEGRTANFPISALGEHGSAMAEALHQKYQAPPALCAQAVLCAMNTAVSSWGQVEAIHGGGMPLSLYLITVAQSGERKTAVGDAAQRGIVVFQRELAETLDAARKATADQEEAELLPSADIIVNEPTMEGLLRTMSRGPGFTCLSNDDAASFFGSHAMSKEKKQKTTATISQLWSGTRVYSPRADGRDAGVEGVPLSMSLMFQPYLNTQVFGDREMVEQGFLARVLPCYPKSTMGTRFFRECPVDAEQRILEFANRVFNTLQEVQVLRQMRETPTDRFAPRLPLLRLSKAARRVLIDFHDEIEVQLAPGGKLEKVRGFAGRATENATRLAGVVALFDDINAQEVPKDAAISASELMRFYIAEFANLLSLAKSQKDESAAGELGAWMARQYGAGGLGHDKEISQFGPPAFRKKGDRQEALRVLREHGWIEMLPKGTVVDGAKRAEAFRVSERISEVL